MPTLDKLASTSLVKMLLMGDSGTGKTGSLVSLVQAGYKLRILDFDGGLPILLAMIRKHCPEKLPNVEARSLNDEFRVGKAGITFKPYAYIEATKMLDHWKYEFNGEVIDYGEPYTWGPDCILVIDTMTFMAEAAYNWADTMNPGAKDKRQIYGAAQDSVEQILAIQKSDDFATNVIFISHIKYIDREDGSSKGYPTAVGSALSPNIPTYFNTTVQTKTLPGTKGGRKTLQTLSSPLVDLKNPTAFDQELPLETGLATFFEALRGPLCLTRQEPQESSQPTTKSQNPTPDVPSTLFVASPKSTQPSKVLTLPLGKPSPLLSIASKK